jgi:type IV pilus assembly protein PilW
MCSPEFHPMRSQRGLSLVELLAGLVVGLMVILAAFGSLVLARSASASIAELAQLQHQGAYALHVIGLQLRQAGAVDAARTEATGLFSFGPTASVGGGVVSGSDGTGAAADSLTVVYAPASVPGDLASSQPAARQYDCTGTRVDGETRVSARFEVNPQGQLMCSGISRRQPLIGNVADFRIAYRVATDRGVQVMSAGAVERARQWSAITAVEICLDLRGDERLPGPDRPREGCTDSDQGRDDRVHMVLRNLYALRTR